MTIGSVGVQDLVKRLQKKHGGATEDFYNILMERPRDDEAGYDLLYVDPIRKGNFGSRVCYMHRGCCVLLCVVVCCCVLCPLKISHTLLLSRTVVA